MKTTVNCTVHECNFNSEGSCTADVIYIDYEGCWTCDVPFGADDEDVAYIENGDVRYKK